MCDEGGGLVAALDSESESPKPENSDKKLILAPMAAPMDMTDEELVDFSFSDGTLFPDDAMLSHTSSGSFAYRKSLMIRNVVPKHIGIDYASCTLCYNIFYMFLLPLQCTDTFTSLVKN